MAQPFLGFIYMGAYNFAPRGYALCNGQLLSIQQNTALFSLLGNTYGGDGQTNFALPNLQSRLPVHAGQGTGLSSYTLGQTDGASSVTITQSTAPAHAHTFTASTTNATSATVSGNLPGTPTVTGALFYATTAGPGQPPLNFKSLGASSMSTAGGNQPHTNLMPSLCITFVIALVGVFPTRN